MSEQVALLFALLLLLGLGIGFAASRLKRRVPEPSMRATLERRLRQGGDFRP